MGVIRLQECLHLSGTRIAQTPAVVQHTHAHREHPQEWDANCWLGEAVGESGARCTWFYDIEEPQREQPKSSKGAGCHRTLKPCCARGLACLARRRLVSWNASCPSALDLKLMLELKLCLIALPLPRAPDDLDQAVAPLALDVKPGGGSIPLAVPPAVAGWLLLSSGRPWLSSTPVLRLPDPTVAGRVQPSPASIFAAIACNCPLRHK